MSARDSCAATYRDATVVSNRPLAEDLRLLDVSVGSEARFQPGHFAMLNLAGDDALVFSRPLSILAAADDVYRFLYRVVGRGTGRLGQLESGSRLTVLAPLGSCFPPPEPGQSDVLIAGGVGLPPLAAWLERHSEADARAFFGARHGGDVAWSLLGDGRWTVALEDPAGAPAGKPCETGLVTDVCRRVLEAAPAAKQRILACGPMPMLRAVVELAKEAGRPCFVSVEEHMGCGYGVCRGCVVPRAGGGHLTACECGPVLDADTIDWRHFGVKGGGDAIA